MLNSKDLYDSIFSRRSIRRYLPLPVEWDKIVTIIEAGSMAVSEGNLQAWRFIIIQDSKTINELAKASYNQLWINQAKAIILVVGDIELVSKFYSDSIFYNTLSSGAVIQNMLLMSSSLGLGSCMVSAFEEDKINEIINIPNGKKPMGFITLGYPAENPIVPSKKQLTELTFIEKWKQAVKDIDLKSKNYRIFNRAQDELKKGFLGLDNILNYIRKIFR
jgi:nitroreductase